MLPSMPSVLTTLTLLLSAASALKFELKPHRSHDAKRERCVRNFVARDTLVVVTATISGARGDGMAVNMRISDSVGNDYGRPRDVAGEQRSVFTSHADAWFDVCFENLFAGEQASLETQSLGTPLSW